MAGTPDHPITISPNPNRVKVTFGGKVVANSTKALSLKEASYPAVAYIPRADVDMSLLKRTAHSTHCPYKGDASYYSAPGSADAFWVYEDPSEVDAKPIEGLLAPWPGRVEVIVE